MPSIEYKLFFNNTAATQEQLDLVEEIVIQQDVDMAWEARLEIPICTDDSGKWSQEDSKILDDFGRVRVEVKVGKAAFVPLIDGPIVGFDSNMSSEPGQSKITVRVQDDSVLLNREEDYESFKDKTDDQVARKLFESIPEIADVKTDPVPPQQTNVKPVEARRGTQMSLLRLLAKRHDMHAYVLPGGKPGKSIGNFKKFPTAGDGLPDMVLLGTDRNISRFDVKNKATTPGKTAGYTISITDKKVIRKTASFQRLDLLGKEKGFKEEKNAGVFLLPPDAVDAVDLDDAVQAKTSVSSYQFEASGSLITECYGKPLAPYRIVTATGVNGRLSGDYVIVGVIHTLNRWSYKQDFKLLRNARSAGSGGGGGLLDKVF
jgi:hypothetical protein